MRNLTIKSKLILSFSLLLLFTVALGGFALNRIGFMSDTTTHLRTEMDAVTILGDMARMSQKLQNDDLLRHYATSDHLRNSIVNDAKKTQQAFSEAWSNYSTLIETSGPEAKLAADLRNAWQHFLAVEEEVLILEDAGERELAGEVMMGDLQQCPVAWCNFCG